MAAAYSDLATLVNSSAFSDRVRVAVTYYARYILNEGADAANHEQRAGWAKGAYQNPSGVASGLLWAVALDDNISAKLGAAADAEIQSATENAVNTILKF